MLARCIFRARRLPGRPIVRCQSNASHESISPTLLSRARAVAVEHSQLSQKLAEQYDTRTAKQAGELKLVTNALKSWDTANDALNELETLLHASDTDAELRDLAAEDLPPTQAALSTAVRDLRSALVPTHPFAELPCLMEIRPGAGGSEAALFVGDLLRMYRAWCGRHGLRAGLVTCTDSLGGANPDSSAGLNEAILEIDSAGAYGALRGEAGVHRVQRIPATESKGRTHTSAASVLVLPSVPDASASGPSGGDGTDAASADQYVDPGEVRVDVMRASGAGGQHVNKTESAVRLTHLPTGTVVAIQESRSQAQNRERAWQVLRARLAQARREAREEEMRALRRSVVGVAKAGRGDKVRTYNWGQQRVTDHRSGLSVHNLDDVVEGGESLDRVMDSVRAWLAEREVEALLADHSRGES